MFLFLDRVPVAGRQRVLCVGNRRLHYAGVVWVVNRWPLLWKPARKRRAPEPKPQGRSRKEKKGSPPHPTHHRSTTLVRSGGHLAAGRRALVSVAVLCKTRISAGLFFFSPLFSFCLFFRGQTGWAAVPETQAKVSQNYLNTFLETAAVQFK